MDGIEAKAREEWREEKNKRQKTLSLKEDEIQCIHCHPLIQVLVKVNQVNAVSNDQIFHILVPGGCN